MPAEIKSARYSQDYCSFRQGIVIIAAYMSGMPAAVPHPSAFFEIRIKKLSLVPAITAVCAGYEAGGWRSAALATHLIKWLPEFALRHSEREALAAHNAVELLYRAALQIYTTDKSEDRGEIGELLLHVILREVYDTIPAISKMFFKDSSNDTVKGFDAVHVVGTPTELELWLGEVKFSEDIRRATYKVVKELEQHMERDYLRAEFAAILNKIDDNWPYAEKLKELLHPNVSLDRVFERICIPVLLTYDSDTIRSFSSVTEEFKRQFELEVLGHWFHFSEQKLPTSVRIHLFLFPMKEKAELVQQFDLRLKACQAMGST